MRESAEAGAGALAGALILAVEDDYVVLLEIATVLSSADAAVVKCSTVDQALQEIEQQLFTAAVLDVRIGRHTIAPVARKLTELGIPFVFYAGHVTPEPALSQWPQARTVSKPAPAGVLVNAVVELIDSVESRARGQ
jgi:DNA-binding NtrC family response regulator